MSPFWKSVAIWSVPVLVVMTMLFAPVHTETICAGDQNASAALCAAGQHTLFGFETSWGTWAAACALGVLGVWLFRKLRAPADKD